MTSRSGDRRLESLRALDLAQVAAAAVIARIDDDDWSRPTPCDEWTVRDVVNKLTASTIMWTAFARREEPDPSLDLVHPREILGDDPLGTYLDVAAECRRAWRAPGAMDGTARSTVGEFPAKAVLNGRIFDTTILTWDIARAIDASHHIGDDLAAYVLFVAERLVPNVRRVDAERYKDAVALDEGSTVDRMVAVTGRDPTWSPPNEARP